MITCDFYLTNRIKTITGQDIMTCWRSFNTDFSEAVSEIVKVKVIDEKNNEHHYSPEQFKARLKAK